MGAASSSLFWNLTITSIAEISFLCDTEWSGLKQFVPQAAGQTLQGGQVLNLQVVRCDVAVFDGAAVEFIKEFLEDIVDADACQDVALLDVAVQGFRDKAFVAERIKTKRQADIYEQLAGFTSKSSEQVLWK